MGICVWSIVMLPLTTALFTRAIYRNRDPLATFTTFVEANVIQSVGLDCGGLALLFTFRYWCEVRDVVEAQRNVDMRPGAPRTTESHAATDVNL